SELADVVVDLDGARGDPGPVEFGDGAGASGLAVAGGQHGVGGDLVDRLGQPVLVVGGGERVVVHQAAGDAAAHDLGDAADIGGDHRGRAGHRLQVHDAERLVDRGADEHRRRGEDLTDLLGGQHLLHPEDMVTGLAQPFDGRGGLGGQCRGVRGAGAQHQLDVGVEVPGGGQQVTDALLPGDAPDEGNDRQVGAYAQ